MMCTPKKKTYTLQNSKILINGSLFLKQLKKEDNGLYVCEATNKFGNANATVYLTVVQKEGMLLRKNITSLTCLFQHITSFYR